MVEKLKKVGLMILSCVLCSIAVNWVALPNGFPVTGIAGISMVLENWTGINYAIIYYGITLLILAATFFVLGIAEVRSILSGSFVDIESYDNICCFGGKTDRGSFVWCVVWRRCRDCSQNRLFLWWDGYTVKDIKKAVFQKW